MKTTRRTINDSALSAKSGPAGRGSVDPQSLMRIKNLELRAKIVVEGFLSGLHRSPYHGFSVEFSDYRQYSPGDDPRYLDWRLFARMDRYYIKRFEDETNLRCTLLVDLSRSMGFGSLPYDKAEYAKTAAATLAFFLALQRDAVGVLTFDEAVTEYLPARYRPGHLLRLMICLQRSLAGQSTDIAQPLEQVARTVGKRGLIVLISDLLAPLQSLERHLGFLRARGHEVVIFRLFDPAEQAFDFSNPAIFEDLETGRDLYVDPHTVRRDYLRRWTEHADQLRAVCDNLGMDCYQVSTDRPLDLILFDFLAARMHRPKPIARRRSTPAGGGGAR